MEMSKYTTVYTEVYPGKVVAFLEEQATFIKASIALIWMKCGLFYKSADKNWLREWINACIANGSKSCQKQQSNEGILMSLSFYMLENVILLIMWLKGENYY